MTGYTVTNEQRAMYQRQGFIKLDQLFSDAQIQELERHVTAAVERLHRPASKPLPNSDSDAYARAFTQVMNLWQHSPAVRQWVFSITLARVAAQLMNVQGVRLYHDQALYKEAGGGYTPWHCDQYYWPLDTDHTITAWIPLQDTPANMGPLAFSEGSHLMDLGRDLPIGQDSEEKITQALQAAALPYRACEFKAGDVSFHGGWTFHRADENASDHPRRAMTVIYMADGARLKAPENANQQADWEAWCPGAKVGEPVATALNPLLYPGQS